MNLLLMIGRRLQLARIRMILIVLALLSSIALVCLLFRLQSVDPECDSKKELLLTKICASYLKNQIDGDLCQPLCHTGKVVLDSCPNSLGHNGKQFVLTAVDYRNSNLKKKIVIKLREFLDEKYKKVKEWPAEEFKDRLERILNATFLSDRFSLKTILSNEQLDNQSNLFRLFVQAQQHEFVLSLALNGHSKIINNQIVPRIVGDCGSLYALEFVPEILSQDLLVPWIKKDAIERASMARAIMKFLLRFEQLALNFDICDPKIEHFGLIDYDWHEFFTIDRKKVVDSDHFEKHTESHKRLLLIDSDMVYHRSIAMENIESIRDCNSDDDCDLVNCQGVCLKKLNQSRCVMRQDEDNLKRICRTILFIRHETIEIQAGDHFDRIDRFDLDAANQMKEIGLLGVLPSVDAGQLERIRVLCSLSNDLSNVHESKRTQTIQRVIEIIQQLDQLITVLEQ